MSSLVVAVPKKYAVLWMVMALTILAILLIPFLVSAASVDLTWDPNSESDLAGYQIYQCTDPSVLVEGATPPSPLPASCTVQDVGNVVQYTAPNLQENHTYYWAGTAYDNADVTSGGAVPRNESAFSNVVTHSVWDTTPPAAPGSLIKGKVTAKLTGDLQGTYSFTWEASEE